MAARILPWALAVFAAASGGALRAEDGMADIAAVRAQIDANNQAVGRAIGMMDVAALTALWSPDMVVNSPGNSILTREQVFSAMKAGKLRETQYRNTSEKLVVSGDVAIEMGHENLVLASGPMAGKPLIRRYTDVWRKTGSGWVQIARQATYVGIDGGAAYGRPDPALSR